MIRHVAVFRFAPTFGAGERAHWMDLLRALPAQIPELRGISVGTDVLGVPSRTNWRSSRISTTSTDSRRTTATLRMPRCSASPLPSRCRSPPSTSKSRTPRDPTRSEPPVPRARTATATSSVSSARASRRRSRRRCTRRRRPHWGCDYEYRILDLIELGRPADGCRSPPRRGEAPGIRRDEHHASRASSSSLDIVDELDTDAAHLRAVNLVVFDGERLIGYNTDWMGYRDGLARRPSRGILRARRADRVRRRRCGDRLRAPLVRHGPARPVRRRRRPRGGPRRADARSFPGADGRDRRT